jgi:TonB family protein
MSWLAEDLTDLQTHRARGGVAGSVGLHAAVLVCLCVLSARRPGFAVPPSTFFGYIGPNHAGTELDQYYPDAMRFHFYQEPRAGAAHGQSLVAREMAARASQPKAGSNTPTPTAKARAHRNPSADGVRRTAPSGPLAATGPAGVEGAEGVDLNEILPVQMPRLQPDVTTSDRYAIDRLVKPVYPQEELNQGISAHVVVAFYATASGDVDDLRVVEATTKPPGSTHVFELMTLEALRQWHVRLAPDLNGLWITVPIDFDPRDRNFSNFSATPEE